MTDNPSFFLGANSAYGFRSAFDDFASDPDVKFLNIIKGGPGCGKSSFMKALATEMSGMGLDVVRFPCSGDPQSLDGVFFPALGTAYVDGTSPHVMEPGCMGIESNYVNFGDFYDRDALLPFEDEIKHWISGYKSAYTRAYRKLASWGSLSGGGAHMPGWDSAQQKADARLLASLKRRLGKPLGGTGRASSRWIDAFTCIGEVFLCDTLRAYADDIILLDNEFGLAHGALRVCADEAVRSGRGVTLCLNPLLPELLNAVIIPGEHLAYVAADRARSSALSGFPHIRLDAMAGGGADERREYRKLQSVCGEILAMARDDLAEAKRCHDSLEALYNPAVDFAGVYALAGKHTENLRALSKAFDKS